MCTDNNKGYFGVTGKIKWFNQFKGYGFVKVEGLSEDIFLHFSVVSHSGIERLNNDDVIICDVMPSSRGLQIVKIIDIAYLNKHELPGEKTSRVTAIMKWFNPAKGFGFAQMTSGEDVFIHSNVLKKSRVSNIIHGQTVLLVVRHTNYGYEALELITDNN